MARYQVVMLYEADGNDAAIKTLESWKLSNGVEVQMLTPVPDPVMFTGLPQEVQGGSVKGVKPEEKAA